MCLLRRFFYLRRGVGQGVRLLQLTGLFLLSLFQGLPTAANAQDGVSLSKPLHARWEYATPQTANLTPAAHQESVYLPLTGGALVSLRASDGDLNWRTELGGEISASPLADERGVYLATETNHAPNDAPPRVTGALRALGRQSGVTLWMRTLPAPIRGGIVSNRTTIFGGASDGRFYALHKQTGEIAWVIQLGSPFLSHPVLHENRLYAGAEDGTLLALDVSSGRIHWRYRTRGPLRTPVAVAPQTVFVGSSDGFGYALSESDGRLRWRVRTGAGVQSVVQTGRGLLVVSLDNFVYLFSFRRGERLWKRQLAGRTAARPLALEDTALFAPLAGDECVVLDLHDGKKVNSLPVGEDNNTAASPVISGGLILVTTRKGLVAFAGPNDEKVEGSAAEPARRRSAQGAGRRLGPGRAGGAGEQLSGARGGDPVADG